MESKKALDISSPNMQFVKSLIGSGVVKKKIDFFDSKVIPQQIVFWMILMD